MNWKIKHAQRETWSKNQIIDHFLKARKISKRKTFLKPLPLTLSRLIKETQINQLQLKKSLTLINKSIKQKRPIIIYGDYDVDGICATAIIWQTLYKIHKQTLPFIPDRFKHGYGLNNKGIKQALKLFPQQNPLIITVDNGITARKVIKKYQQKGVNFIVTDHHQMPKIKPKPFALIHSTAVCGAALSFLLSASINKFSSKYMDIIALATVCDQMPLVGINRDLVIAGLKKINRSPSLGLQALANISAINTSLTAYHLGFMLGPRLNAAGRLKDPLIALRLLCTRQQNHSTSLAKQLNNLNLNRQQLTATSIETALKKINKLKSIPPIISIHHPSFHQGIIGLIAGRLAGKFNRPAIALSGQDNYLKASARSSNNFDLISFLRQKQELFEELGGHPSAVGFVIKKQNLKNLKKFLNSAKIKTDTPAKLNIDLLLHPQQNLNQLHQAFTALAPFGQGWPEPILALQNTKVVSYKYVGQHKNHLQLKIKHRGKTISAIAFKQPSGFSPSNINLAFTLSQNTYKGTASLQFLVKHLKKTAP